MCYCTPQIRTPFCHNCPPAMFERIAKLEAENAELRKDAARYRWLRDKLLGADFAWGEPPTCVWVFETDAPISANLDAAIDAAMGEQP
jgi:hypothetical protein